VIPKPLAWGITLILTGLEVLNVVAAVFVEGYQADTIFHAVFGTIVGFMLGMKEGNGVVARAISAVRGTGTTPPPPPPEPEPPAGPQGRPTP
jgi:hypothetical protein